MRCQSQRRERKKEHGTRLGPPSPDSSSLDESSSDVDKKEEADQTDENDDQGKEESKTQAEPPGPFDPPLSRSGGSERASSVKSSKKQSSAGSWKADQKRSQLDMQRMLGALEPSHRKPPSYFSAVGVGASVYEKVWIEQGTAIFGD